MSLPTHRRAFRRTDSFTPNTPKLKLVTEPLPSDLSPTQILIQVHAISLNYRDANIANGNNPWPVIPHGIPCNDASGTIIAIGSNVTRFKPGDHVAPNNDTQNLTGREKERSWLAADEDGVLADFLVFDERVCALLPGHLDLQEASILPCAGVTAWSALRDVCFGQTVLIQGTGGVAMFALKLARESGSRIILSSSSDEKLGDVKRRCRQPWIETVNYRSNEEWEEEVLRITEGRGVDCVIEVGGTESLVKSVRCTKRGGIVSVVGYLSGDTGLEGMKELLPLVIDRRVNLRGINCGSVADWEDLCAAVAATKMRFGDIIDSTRPFEEAEEALQYIWEGKQVGKLVLTV